MRPHPSATRVSTRPVAVAAAAAVLALTAWVGAPACAQTAAPTHAAASRWTARTSHSYAAARSALDRDSMYPAYGNTVVDALHYGLDLTWRPATGTLSGTEHLVMRAARASRVIPLDLSARLALRRASVDGHAVHVTRSGHRIRLGHAVAAGQRVAVTLAYSGKPGPVAAPSDRSDMAGGLGFTPTDDGGAWTTQEPYGAFTWYAVNDEPADKAFYDMTLHVPAPMVGVSNGQLRSRQTVNGVTTTRFHLADPAASYLTTVAFGRYTHHRLGTVHGVRVTSWTPTGQQLAAKKVAALPSLLRWLDKRLGRFPFPSLSIVVVPTDTGMETQQTITIGSTAYDLRRDTLLHEIAHQWYGDEVTPADWSDLWMSEGMAMYLQTLYLDSTHGVAPGTNLDEWGSIAYDNEVREIDGPPAAYNPNEFAEDDVYLPPARMWHTLRERLGGRFLTLVRQWPASQAFTSSSRAELADWWSRHSGQDLHPFFHHWLLDARDPKNAVS